MTIKALRFKADSPTPEPVRQDLSIGSAADLLKLKGDHPQAAFVVSHSDLKLILEFGEAVIDCGEKSDSKELARLMLGQQKENKKEKKERKVPAISAGFTTAGRVEQGVRALLKKTSSRKDNNIYVIGIQDQLFQEFLGRCESAGARRRRKKPVKNAGDLLTPEYLESTLLAETEPLPIAEGLSAAYVGDSASVQNVLQQVMRAAGTNAPVLVLGESGTGKGIVARQIHENSARQSRPFVAVNCNAIPTELFELEFFGCVADLTHKAPVRIGHCEAAGSGTLFLDEVADLSLFHQGKLLRLLEEKDFRRIGSPHSTEFSARVIAATNRDLFEMKRSGGFRDDLYYRLRGMMIFTPALRSHREDILMLANCFWESISLGKAPPLSAKVVAELKNYPWSGNVRDLKLFLNTAYSCFGSRPLNIRRIRLLWLSEEYMRSSRLSTSSAGKQTDPPWVDCLQHLRQVTEFMHAVRETLKAIESGQPLEGAEAQTHRESVLNRLNEIDMLSRNQVRFGNDAVRSVVGALNEVKGSLKLMCVYLEKDWPRAAEQKKAVERKIKLAQPVIRRGIEGLFSKI